MKTNNVLVIKPICSSEEDIRTLKEKLIEKFATWCEQSTSHGIPNIARSRNWFMRIMWALFFLGSLAYCSNLIIKSFIDFFLQKMNIRLILILILIID